MPYHNRVIAITLGLLAAGGILLFFLLLPLTELKTRHFQGPVGFVGMRGDQLMDGGKPFRFLSVNVPCLHYNEDHLPFDQTEPWRLPVEFEIRDALESVNQMGGTVVRLYALSVRRSTDPSGRPRHIEAPGVLNEQAFRTLDLVLQLANETGVRVIIPFVDNWHWWGGVEDHAAFRGKPKEAFWTDPQLITDFKNVIKQVVERKNTRTGRLYKDDGAILAWETGNELESPKAWTADIAAYIESLDPNHLLIDGFGSKTVRSFSLEDPHIDIVTTHHYAGDDDALEVVARNWRRCEGKKPYIIGEFGFFDYPAMEQMMNAIVDSGISGALVWSLRYHNRDGGFYWHSEPHGENKHKAYHWPGFPSGDEYEETRVLGLLHRKAFAIREMPLPKAQVPEKPRLLAILDPGRISWQGSVGATHYRVERAAEPAGPWRPVGSQVCDASIAYRPLFADTGVTSGIVYYRVVAQNVAGDSDPSNVVGPVRVPGGVLIDPMSDMSKLHRRNGQGLSIRTDQARKAKEDWGRLGGLPGDEIIYALAGTIKTSVVDTFFPGEVEHFEFAVSSDGQAFSPIEAVRQDYDVGAGDYDYWHPVRYIIEFPPARENRYLSIRYQGEAQIAHVEIRWSEE